MSLNGRRDDSEGQNSLPNRSHGLSLEGLETISDEDASCPMNHGAPLSLSKEKWPVSRLGHAFQKILNKGEQSASTSRMDDSSALSDISSDTSNPSNDGPITCEFKEGLEVMSSASQSEMPENLKGGILFDKSYVTSSKDLTILLFESDSKFRKDLALIQGTADYHEGPWMWKSMEKIFLTRVVTYVNGENKFFKSVNAIEEQTFIKADGRQFAVLASVTTPDIPYGNCFQVETLYKIMPGRRSPVGDEVARLLISWEVNFYHRTAMRNVIEAGAKQGLKNSFGKFEKFLDQVLKPIAYIDGTSEGKQLPVHREHRSNFDIALEYFWNYTVIFTFFTGLYIFVHIFLSEFDSNKGLEFIGLDLPDSFGELITAGVFVLMCERVVNMIQRFIEVRIQRENQQSIKAPGDGWLITVALVEAINLPPSGLSNSLDPYVVLMCNGKSRTSSVQLQTLDPQWNEILEFDAMRDPPSILDVEVCNYDGKFDATSSPIAHAEISFLRHSPADLADMWVPLQGKLAQAYNSKLHLRVFLDNTKGETAVMDYYNKVEKEVGKKLNHPSPEKISTFHKIFGLPPDEILVNSFPSYLRRKLLLQGKLYVSARIIGFYSSFLGYKTKFFLLWEDIEDIIVAPPSLATIGCPSVSLILRKGRGLEACHGAKSVDSEGRFRFQFLPFISHAEANRMIMALWRARSPPSELAEEATST